MQTGAVWRARSTHQQRERGRRGEKPIQLTQEGSRLAVGMRRLEVDMARLAVGMARLAVGMARLVVGMAHLAVGMARVSFDCYCYYYCWFGGGSEYLKRVVGLPRS